MADPQLTPEPLGATPAPLPPTITWAGMTRVRFAAGRAMGPPRVLVLHATAGSHPGDYHWLRKGGGETPDTYVSCHYYIDKGGRIAQLVRDHDAAYHCGASSWAVDGQQVGGSHAGVARLNWLSIGCELENRNTGADPYPAAQVDAAVALFRWLAATYQIPRGQVVRHRDIAPERKTDPAGFPWDSFLDRVFAGAAPPATPVIGVPPSIQLGTFIAVCRDHRAPFAPPYFELIATRIYTLAAWLEIDPAFWLAVWLHEQGSPLGGSAVGQATLGPLNIKAYDQRATIPAGEQPRWPRVRLNGAFWNAYESWQLGALHSLMHLKQIYGAAGLLTAEAIIGRFAPDEDGNDPRSYLAAVQRDMAAMRAREGR